MSEDSDLGDRSSGSISTSVLNRAIQGDESAFEAIKELYGGLVYIWCRNQHVIESEIPDVFQEVFISVSQGIRSFRRNHPGQSFRAWIRTITRRKIADFWKKWKTLEQPEGGSDAFRRLQELEEPFVPHDDLETGQETGVLVQAAVKLIQDTFSQRDFEVFWRVAVDNGAVSEVSEEFGMSHGNVYTIISRIKRRVRQEYQELIDEGEAEEAT